MKMANMLLSLMCRKNNLPLGENRFFTLMKERQILFEVTGSRLRWQPNFSIFKIAEALELYNQETQASLWVTEVETLNKGGWRTVGSRKLLARKGLKYTKAL